MSTPVPAQSLANADAVLHCCETWHALAGAGTVLPNRPEQDATWEAIRGIHTDLLRPIEEQFGPVTVTYGFAGAELVKAVKKRAEDGKWLPNIHPPSDQHAGHELNARGKRICEQDGFAVDLSVTGFASDAIVQWIRENLPFDAIYLYGPEKPFHLSWARAPRGTVLSMRPKKNAPGLHPITVVRGRKVPTPL